MQCLRWPDRQFASGEVLPRVRRPVGGRRRPRAPDDGDRGVPRDSWHGVLARKGRSGVGGPPLMRWRPGIRKRPRSSLDPVLERMIEAVHRYEGMVNQVMGDGIMALFGAPVTHEDHAVRACYAALRMQDAVGRYAAPQSRHGRPDPGGPECRRGRRPRPTEKGLYVDYPLAAVMSPGHWPRSRRSDRHVRWPLLGDPFWLWSHVP